MPTSKSTDLLVIRFEYAAAVFFFLYGIYTSIVASTWLGIRLILFSFVLVLVTRWMAKGLYEIHEEAAGQ